ncbi:MAG: hypothetical protein HUU35_02980, partial [Armatimonadetes bacterium]|nr:hypothetical protein [Armatimonadota bacterium]
PTDPASERATWERLRPLAASLARPLVAVGRYGVEARAARVGQRLILNLCNYRPESETVALPDGFHDAFTGAAVGAALELAPLLPRLLINATAAPP